MNKVLSVCLLCATASLSSPGQEARFTLPEGFTIERVTTPELTSYPMFMAFDDAGQLFIAESTGKDLSGKEMQAMPECQILRLVDTNGDGVYDKRTVFAEELSLPMGVLWHQGSVFVASPPEFLRFDDTDDDGVADVRTVLHSGWNVFNTASLHGPFLGPDGMLYLTHGRHGYDITTKEGEHLQGLASRIWRCWPDGSGLERFAGGGFDNPVELVFLPSGEMIGTMTYFTDPKFGQRDALMQYVRGGVYPKLHDSTSEFIQTGPDLMPVMSKFSRIAPAGLERYEGGGFGAEYDGMLFSAQFNPHRVQQHQLIRDGASYRTEDADFLTSSDPDFYPTDVLQDADGSLLVSDTGAWYVDACPVSRIAKPEVKGGIYRIRKTNAAPAQRRNDDSEYKTRLDAVHMASREDSPGRLATLRAALHDPSIDISMSAIQALGELKDAESVPALEAILQGDVLPLKRAAATALGQIGDPAVIPALIDASHRADRFVQHAITYALIEIADQDALFEAVKAGKDDPDAGYINALTALDQLGDARVQTDMVLPMISSDNAEYVKTGLWIASRHDALAPELMTYLRGELERPDFAASENIRRALLAYAKLDSLQAIIGELLVQDGIPESTMLFLFDTIDGMTLPEVPTVLIEGIGAYLAGTSTATLRWAALALVQSKDIRGLEDALLGIARDTSEEPAFRIAALSAASARLEMLPDDDFAYVSGVLRKGDEPTLRQAAARVLAGAALTSEQKLVIAKELLPTADSMALTSLIVPLNGAEDEALGFALVSALKANGSTTEYLTPQQLTAALAGYSDAVRHAAEPLFASMQTQDAENVERFIALEAKLGTGDVGRGRRIFFGTDATCSTCHAIGTDGGDFGPDLTTIGEVRTGHDLLEAIMFPNSSFVPEFTPYQIETSDDVHMGLIERETDSGITLRIDPQTRTLVSRDAITAMNVSTLSLMPEGLDAGLTDEELIDLVTFLQTLDGNSFLEVAKH